MAIEYAFAAVPHAVLYDKRLSMEAKVIYALLKSRAMDKNYCLVSQPRLAEDAGMGLRTVERYIAELKDFGLISVDKRKNNSAVTVIRPVSAVYSTCSAPFVSEPQNEGGDTAKSDGTYRQIWRSGPANCGGQDPPGVAGKEEEGEQEKEIVADLMEALEDDPKISSAAKHQAAQTKKGRESARKRLDAPTEPNRQPIEDSSLRYLKTVPGNISDDKVWSRLKIFRAFKSAAATQGLTISGLDPNNAVYIGKIVGQLTEQGLSRKQAWEFLFHHLIPNWIAITERVFKRVNVSNPRIISLGMLESRLPDVLATKGNVSSEQFDEAAIAELKSKMTPGVVT